MNRRPGHLVLGALFMALFAASFAIGIVQSSLRDYQREDFDCFRSAARLVLIGADPYDPAVWTTTTGLPGSSADGPRRTACTGNRFAYPLWTAIPLLPFALIPYPTTAALWLALNIVIALGGTLLAFRAAGGAWRRAPLAIVLVVASQPFVVSMQYGQLAGIEAGLLGLALWALSLKREATAGAMLALALLKPQLLAVTVPWLALRSILDRTSRSFVAFTIGAAALLGLSLVMRSTWISPWLAEIAGPRLGIARLLPTPWGFATDLWGNAVWGWLIAAGVVVVVAVLGRSANAVEGLALATALSLAVTPHVWSYDYVLLAPAWALLLARAERLGSLLLLMLLASLLPWVLYAIAQSRATETLSLIVPVATSLTLAAMIRRQAPRNALVLTQDPPPARS